MFARQPSIDSGTVRFQGEVSSAATSHYDQQEHSEKQELKAVPSVPVSADEYKRDELREDIRLRGDPEDEVALV